jgi:hypothetical protein
MSWHDYIANFNNISLCRLYHDEIGKIWAKSVWTVCTCDLDL